LNPIVKNQLPFVYPSQSFEKTPPLAACSFQLALLPAISDPPESLFCDWRLEKRPEPDPLERRRSLTVGGLFEVFVSAPALLEEAEPEESLM